MLDPGRNCWRIERANRARLIVDAADYFRLAREAMLGARSQILLIGWDVDTRIRMVDDKGPSGAPVALGPFLSWIAARRPGLRIYILPWGQGLFMVPARGTTMFRMLRWGLDKSIATKWDNVHPLAASHHQKILVVDDAIAFCGGIDIAGDRWDTRQHRDEEPGRKRPFTRRRYDPWHDATMAVDGDAAEALGDLCRIRWKAATGKDLTVPPRSDHDPWPESLEPSFRNVSIGIARTRGKAKTLAEIREIETLFVDLIAAAKRFVYVETQYFASRAIGEAIAKRLVEPNPPEFVIMNPRTAYGWLDERVMNPARYELVEAIGKADHRCRFRIYAPVTECGADIYVHAKIMIVDDLVLRVGSANMNNRSMGLDSECDLLLDSRLCAEPDVAATISRIRVDLLAEHLGVEPNVVAEHFEETGSLIATIDALRGYGRTVVPLPLNKPTKLEATIANHEVLDPESADEEFEPSAGHKLLGAFRAGRARRRSG